VSDNNNNNNNGKKKKIKIIVKTKKKNKHNSFGTTITPKDDYDNGGGGRFTPIELHEKLEAIHRKAMKVLEDPNKSGSGGGGRGEDEIHAIRTILALEGYGPDKLAEGWRKQHGNYYFHQF
jgi:hypothetical protein